MSRSRVTYVGTLLICGGILLQARLGAAIDQRVSEGTAVTGRIVQADRFRVSRSYAVTRMTVAYAVDAVAYQERFSSELDEGRRHAGEELTVYVDRGDPSKAATADGYATEDLLLQLPAVLGVAGALAIVAALVWIRTARRPDVGGLPSAATSRSLASRHRWLRAPLSWAIHGPVTVAGSGHEGNSALPPDAGVAGITTG